MRDYAELISDLRRHHCDAKEDDTQEVCEECAYDVIVADKSKFNGITDVCTCGLMHRAADAIEELLSKVPRWISGEERLPEPGERVLVTNGGFVCESYLSQSGKWQRGGVDMFFMTPSHWMPLPEAPKEE